MPRKTQPIPTNAWRDASRINEAGAFAGRLRKRTETESARTMTLIIRRNDDITQDLSLAEHP
jgi:hypothetical protein